MLVASPQQIPYLTARTAFLVKFALQTLARKGEGQSLRYMHLILDSPPGIRDDAA
jgi:hypothetical protein